MKNVPGRPKRVTVRAIGTELRLHAFLKMHMGKLPLTKLALKSHVESTEQFALHRIRLAAETFVIQRIRATRSNVIRAAGIGPTTNRMPSVQQALLDAKEYVDGCLDGMASNI
jgi:hypothetical protein